MVKTIEDEDQIWSTLIQCLLSSQTSFRIAEDATSQLKKKGLLDRNFLANDPEAETQVRELLQRRGVRFWRKKSKSIIINAKRFRDLTIQNMFAEFADEQQARIFFKKRVHGFGMKQASMFLRDIEYTQNLAIIDRHVLRWMVKQGLIDEKYASRETILDSEYLSIERKFVEYANQQGIPPGKLDLIVWGRSATGQSRTLNDDH